MNIARKHLRHAWAWSEWKLSEEEALHLGESAQIISELNKGDQDQLAKVKKPMNFFEGLLKKLGIKLKGK